MFHNLYVVTNLYISYRFKIHLLLKDDTGETKVMLLDTVAEPILGVSAEVLLNGSLEEVYTSCNFTFILWVAFVVFNVVFISI